MKKLVCFMFVLCLPLFVGCGSNELATTPDLKIYAGEQELVIVKGGYEWSKKVNYFETQTEVADAASPEQIAENLKGDIVLPQDELRLVFTAKPDRVKVIAWGETKNKEVNASDDILVVPTESGTYIYEIYAEWPQGHVSYTVKLIVQ